MALTLIQAVRLKTSDRSSITRESSVGDGETKYYKLGHGSILLDPALEARKNGGILVQDVDYTIDLMNGVVDFSTIPALNDQLEFIYYWSVYSDDEVQYFIDEAGGDITIAAARNLLAWAADAARLSKRQTLSGGGGQGQVSIDTSVAARELRAVAKALIEMEAQLGESIPAEGLTEVPWTEFDYKDEVDQSFIRRM